MSLALSTWVLLISLMQLINILFASASAAAVLLTVTVP